jgi:thiol-disulfide isomerase/thioredoxin
MTRSRWLGLALFGLSAAGGCGGVHADRPADAQTTVVSLRRIDCTSCGYELVDDLRNQPGVYDATYDPSRVEITVTASPSFDVFTRVRRLAANEGFEAILGAGHGEYLADAQFPVGVDYRRIVVRRDQRLDLKTVLASGKVTVVDFTATWCRPCREVDTHLRGILAADAGVAYRKVDIGDWDTAVVEQHLADVPALPYVVVFSPAGERVGTIAGLDLDRLDAAIADAAQTNESEGAKP